MSEIKTPPQFKLLPHEIDSALWKKIAAHLEERLQSYHKQNASLLSIEQTNLLRGQIKECSRMLDLGKKSPEGASAG
jgi:hypothetical protein